MSLTIKAYLQKDDDPSSEIRRFGVPPDVPDYHLLRQKLAEVFPSLKHGFFSVHWKDPEGDNIILSSDQELAEAITSVRDSILKIYITVTPQPAPSGDLHKGVSCNNCHGAVQGARYKCCVCADYNLCRQCEIQGAHPDHDMWKITTPSEKWMPQYGEQFIPHHVLECIRQNQKDYPEGNRPSCCSTSAGSGPQGAWASATSSSGSTSAASGDNMTWEDVGRAWAEYGFSWNNAAKKFSHSLAKTMNPFGEMDMGDANTNRCDLQCDGVYDDDDVTSPEQHDNEVNARETELEQAMFGDGSSKSSTHTGRYESDSGTSRNVRVRVGLPGPIHPDPKIAKALIQMLSMGFTDKEGRLTRLLELKEGDISQVIEAINQSEWK
ncbi:sequestosome-1-like [Gigantopelta aegis]|uniref:sequestosome-1-like n=1 Tax=Gigantopelta aegis TaxID=1735272 RepID=UPI001B88BDDE|nr:sequestosome-1-like [Gigantopelta aegis]